jgi:hypothetical protein
MEYRRRNLLDEELDYEAQTWPYPRPSFCSLLWNECVKLMRRFVRM